MTEHQTVSSRHRPPQHPPPASSCSKTAGSSAAPATAPPGTALGEAVFATGMTGYQETITDPSYARQLVVQTAPHIGNTGVNNDDAESRRIWVAGYIVRDAARRPSNWRSERSLDDELVEQGIVGIQGVDTRAITRHLREHKTMRAGIFSGDAARATDKELVDAVLASAPMEGSRLAEEVSVDDAYTVEPKDFGWDGEPRFSIAAIDLGIKAHDPGPVRRARGPGARAARHGHPRRRPGRQPRRLLHVQRPRRPRHRRQPGGAAALGARREDPVLRHLLRQPDPGPRPRASAPTSSATATAASTSP